jgi:hypothetical protein
MPDGTDFVMQEYESSWFAEQGHVAWQRMLNGK